MIKPIWRHSHIFFHHVSEVEIDYSGDFKHETMMVTITFKNSEGQQGTIDIFLDEGAKLIWPERVKKKSKGFGWIPAKIRFIRKKPGESEEDHSTCEATGEKGGLSDD